MFRLEVDREVSLVLAEERHAPALAALGSRNRARLAEVEPWAEAEDAFRVETTAAYLRRALEGFASGQQVQTIIALDAGALFVGSCGLRIDPHRHVADVGYWIDADFEGRGLVTRAAAALTVMAFEEIGVERVELRTAPTNRRSQAVAARLGFRLEGRQRRALRFRDRADDLLVFVGHPGAADVHRWIGR